MADCNCLSLFLLKLNGSGWFVESNVILRLFQNTTGIGEMDEWDASTEISKIQLPCHLDMLDKEEEIRNQEKVPCNGTRGRFQPGKLVMSHLPDVGITAQLCIEEPSYPTHGLCGTCSEAV